MRQSVQRQLTCGPVHVNPSHKPRRTPHGPNNESTSLPSDDEVGGAVMVAVAGAEATDEAAEAEADAEEAVMVATVAEEAGVVATVAEAEARNGCAQYLRSVVAVAEEAKLVAAAAEADARNGCAQ